MKSSQKVIFELKKLNEKIETLGNNNRFMVYTTKPFKFIFYNFIAGVSYSLGVLFGTAVIATAIIYILARINFTKPLASWIEGTLSQIKWEKIINPSSNQQFIQQNDYLREGN